MSDTDVGLQLVDVSHCHGDRTILSAESFVLSPGSTVVVTGANGVGKSTLLYLCAGLVPADAGRVKLGGASVDPSRPSDLIRQGVRCGFVFQQGGLLANLSALANVALGMRYHADVFRLSERSVEERTRASCPVLAAARSTCSWARRCLPRDTTLPGSRWLASWVRMLHLGCPTSGRRSARFSC